MGGVRDAQTKQDGWPSCARARVYLCVHLKVSQTDSRSDGHPIRNQSNPTQNLIVQTDDTQQTRRSGLG